MKLRTVTLLFIYCLLPDLTASGNTGDYVILLHGLARSSDSMRPLEQYLKSKGYHTVNIDYPSRKYTIKSLTTNYLKPVIEQISNTTNKKIHFVTHSMGGILAREYLKHHSLTNPGRMVMLSPPNSGSEAADYFKTIPLFSDFMGPALSELGTGHQSIPLLLGSCEFEFGVITGKSSINPFNSLIIPGEDDGTVAVKRARHRDMKDFLVVERSHTFIMEASEVHNEVHHFLRTGTFFKLPAKAFRFSLLNCFLLLVPLFIWNLLFYRKLPAVMQTEPEGIPRYILHLEHILRGCVFITPLFFPIIPEEPTIRITLTLYAAGMLLYCTSWFPLLFYPKSKKTRRLPIWTSPSYTPLVPLLAIALIGGSPAYAIASVLFTAVHFYHERCRYLQTIKRQLSPLANRTIKC